MTDDSLMLSVLKEIRAELHQHRAMLLQLVDASQRQDRRFNEIERRISPQLKSLASCFVIETTE